MKCTSCKSGELRSDLLEDLILCKTCDNCGGSLVMIEDFLKWKEQYGELPVADDYELVEEPEENKKAIVCPVTGRLMIKYRISKNTDHRLDFSPEINGIWMDKGEWELLKSEGLANTLSHVFTDHWQYSVKEDTAKDHFEAMYKNEFGEDDYARLKEFREWLVSNENKRHMLAYLMAEDPYSARR